MEAAAPRIARTPRLAARDVRLMAFLLDLLLAGIALAPGVLILWQLARPGDALLFWVGVVLVVLGGAAITAVQVVLLGTSGQTLGKRLLGVRIVRSDDEGNPGYVKAVLLRGVVILLIGVIPVAGSVFLLVDLLFIFGDDQRCLHDYIAGTKVTPA
jgi:uncharacterized RDD family membrane protein YckC